ncbi:hypothetical protein, partial [Streptomyces anulatus]|uniref:hypothetical protein n=1 Tax=Streptomyces anulatus TaxID=1892 RepID=UPI0033275679
AVVLLGEDLGGCEHRGLATGVDHGEHGAQSHLDALALCHGHGSYLPRPYQETSTPVPTAVELRTDASDVAGELARHDRQYGTSTTGGVPASLEDGCTHSDRDAVRAYARREWITRQERWPGI